MITFFSIITLFVFLKVIGFIFSAGFRILGWILGGIGFLISAALAITVLGTLYFIFPALLIIGVIMLAMKP